MLSIDNKSNKVSHSHKNRSKIFDKNYKSSPIKNKNLSR